MGNVNESKKGVLAKYVLVQWPHAIHSDCHGVAPRSGVNRESKLMFILSSDKDRFCPA